MSFTTYLAVTLGGALGTLARYILSVLMISLSRELPFGTIVINVLGCFLIGFFGTLTLAQGRFPMPENLRLFVMVGICGGFTTFSSFSLQTLDLLRSGSLMRASLNVFVSIVFCLVAVAFGHILAAHMNGDALQIVQNAIEEES